MLILNGNMYQEFTQQGCDNCCFQGTDYDGCQACDKSHIYKYTGHQQEISGYTGWHRFAFLPTKVKDTKTGKQKTIWLRTYQQEEKYSGNTLLYKLKYK